MREILILTAPEAIKRIRPGAIKAVRLLFQSRDNHVSLVCVPKVHAKMMLRGLPSAATVQIEILRSGEFAIATIAGVINPVRRGEISEAAGVVRRMQ